MRLHFILLLLLCFVITWFLLSLAHIALALKAFAATDMFLKAAWPHTAEEYD